MWSYLRMVPQQTADSKTTSWAVAKFHVLRGGLCNGLDPAWWGYCSSKARKEGMELGDKRVSCLPSRHVGIQHSGSGPSPPGGAASSMKATYCSVSMVEPPFCPAVSFPPRCTQLLSTTSLCSPACMSCISQGGEGSERPALFFFQLVLWALLANSIGAASWRWLVPNETNSLGNPTVRLHLHTLGCASAHFLLVPFIQWLCLIEHESVQCVLGFSA